MTLNLTRSNICHICVRSIYKSQIFLSDQPFSRYRPVWDKCTEWPRNDLEPYMYPYVLLVSLSLKFQSFSLYGPSFSTYSPFWDNFWMTPKWPWTLQGQKLPHICVASVPKSQISVHFAQPVVFKLQAILKKVHQITPKWPWTLQGQMYPIHVLLVSMSPKFQSMSLYDPVFFEMQAMLR